MHLKTITNVIPTPYVPILKDPIYVDVEKDTLVTVKTAQVHKLKLYYFFFLVCIISLFAFAI